MTLLWLLLNVVGVFDQVTQIVSSTGLDAGGFDLANVLSLSTVLSAVTIFSIIEVVLFTVLVVILTLLYNVVSTLVAPCDEIGGCITAHALEQIAVYLVLAICIPGVAEFLQTDAVQLGNVAPRCREAEARIYQP